jgi:hypothetical protein
MKQQIIKKDGKPDTDKETLWLWVNNYISRYKDGSCFEWEIKIRTRKKSNPQRKLYFASILPSFMSAVGYDPPEYLDVHRFLKIRWFEPQAGLLVECGLKPITKDDHGYYHNVPDLFSSKSQIPVGIRTKYIDWVTRIASQYGAEI